MKNFVKFHVSINCEILFYFKSWSRKFARVLSSTSRFLKEDFFKNHRRLLVFPTGDIWIFPFIAVWRGKSKKRNLFQIKREKKASDKNEESFQGGDEIHQENVFLCEIRYASASCSEKKKKYAKKKR